MAWIEYDQTKLPYKQGIKQGTIVTDGEAFCFVGEVNESLGVNDEFTAEITHFTNDYINTISELIERAKDEFKRTKQNN